VFIALEELWFIGKNTDIQYEVGAGPKENF